MSWFTKLLNCHSGRLLEINSMAHHPQQYISEVHIQDILPPHEWHITQVKQLSTGSNNTTKAKKKRVNAETDYLSQYKYKIQWAQKANKLTPEWIPQRSHRNPLQSALFSVCSHNMPVTSIHDKSNNGLSRCQKCWITEKINNLCF